MVIQLDNGRVVTVREIKDLEELVDHEVFQAFMYIYEYGEDSNLRQRYENLEQEFNSYEGTLDSNHSAFVNLQDELEACQKYIRDTKKLNKEELIKRLEIMITEINNQI